MNQELKYPNLMIREATIADHDAILKITSSVFGGSTFEKNIDDTYGIIGGKDWEWRKRRHLIEDLEDDQGKCLVALEGEVVLGYVTMRMNYEAKIGHVPNLAVEKTAANQGIGRALLNQACQVMRMEGMELARIETLEQNPVGRYLYPDVGFGEIARQIYFAMDLRQVQTGD